MLYCIFIFLLIFGRYIKTKRGLILLILLFSILVGFRDTTVGKDTWQYIDIFNNIGSDGYNGFPEPLYGYANLLFYKLGCSFPMFQMLLSLITFGLIGTVIIHHSLNYGYSMFVLYGCFFVFYMMNITRQIFAVSILAYGYHLLYYNRRTKFIICVIVATLCHYSSIIALGVLLIRKLELTPKLIITAVALSFVIGMVISDSMIMSIAGRYAQYLTSDSNGMRSGIRVFQAILLAGWWSALFLLIYFLSPRQNTNNMWFKIYFIAIIINNILLNAELGLRCTLYFSISQIIVFAQFITQNKIKNTIPPSLITGIFITVFFTIFLFNGSTGVVPYKFTRF